MDHLFLLQRPLSRPLWREPRTSASSTHLSSTYLVPTELRRSFGSSQHRFLAKL
ncbi:ORFL222W.iORF1 [Human betaherpesvirus 5]|nr:ORFL222W.iORF1 [Human betaherpesvirus 5]QHX40584.1 ORFL222W.iORF1 [Human betaherpesvirus 5]